MSGPCHILVVTELNMADRIVVRKSRNEVSIIALATIRYTPRHLPIHRIQLRRALQLVAKFNKTRWL